MAVGLLLLLSAPALADDPPETTITDGPPEGSVWGPEGYPISYESGGGTLYTSIDVFHFASDDDGADFECRERAPGNDGAWTAWYSCNEGGYGDGVYRWRDFSASGPAAFGVRAVSADGTPDPTPAERGFTIDVTPPETTITGGPPANELFSPSHAPPLTFTSSESGSTFECRIILPGDRGKYAVIPDCESPAAPEFMCSAHEVDGAKFIVWATDPVGNADPSPAELPLIVDCDSPRTGFHSEPRGPISDSTPTFDWWVDDPTATVTCRIDETRFVDCPSPATYGPLDDGRHTFELHAIDPAGNQSKMSLTVILVDTRVSGAGMKLRGAKRGGPKRLAVIGRAGAKERTKATMRARVRIDGRKFRLESKLVKIPGEKRRKVRALPRNRAEAAKLGRALRDGDRIKVRAVTNFRDRLGNSAKRVRRGKLRVR